MIRVANANMVNALKLVSVNRGFDPREFTLVAFGGGGGAARGRAGPRARHLRKSMVPVNAAVFSAWGMLMTDLRRDLRAHPRRARWSRPRPARSRRRYDELCRRRWPRYSRRTTPMSRRLSVVRYADMRYVGQEHSVKVEFPGGHRHRRCDRPGDRGLPRRARARVRLPAGSPVELVNFHVAGLLPVAKPALPRIDGDRRRPATRAARAPARRLRRGRHPRVARSISARGCRRTPGSTGPAIVEEPATTIVVPPGDSARVDEYGNIHITIEQERPG